MRRSTHVLMVAAWLALVPAGTGAAAILDQQFAPGEVNTWTIFSELTRAQTFTVGMAGLLSRVEVLLDTAPGLAALDRPFQVVPTVGGVAVYGTAPLASFTITAPGNTGSGSVLGFYGADLTAFGLQVTPGEVLAIVSLGAPAPDSSHWWAGRFTAPPTYLGGAHYTTFYSGGQSDTTFHLQDTTKVVYDLGFRTWVDTGAPEPEPEPIPEPALVMLFGVGVAALRRLRR